MTRESKTSPRKIKALERELIAVQAKVKGHSYPDIARMLGVTPQAAHAAVKRAMAKAHALIADSADEMRVLRTQQYERLLLALSGGIQKGDVASINSATKIIQSLVELWATAVPKQTVVTGPNGGPLEHVVGTWEDVVLMAQAARAQAEASVGGGPVVDVTPEPSGLLSPGEGAEGEGVVVDVEAGGDAQGEP